MKTQYGFLKAMPLLLVVLFAYNARSFAQIEQANENNELLKVQEFVLDNGFTVLLNEDSTQTEIMGGVVIKAGGKHDPADQTGIAHYLEHMLFKGTDQMGTIDFEKENVYLKKIYGLYEKLGQTTDEVERKAIQKEINENSLKAGEFAILNEMDNLLRSIGSQRINAFTGDEITFYFNTFPPNQFEPWAEIYSHRFISPVFRAFQAELEVVYEEKNMYMDNFSTSLMETFMSNFYKNHPYGQQTILGDVEHLKNPSLNRLYDFYNTYYVANNMALVLSGDFKAEEVMPVIEKKFGRLKKGEVPDYPEYVEEEFNGRERVKARLTPVKVGIVGFRAPAKGHEDEVALNVALNLLSNSAETGYFDKLTLEGKLMAAMAFPLMANNDYGQVSFLFVPKLIFQSHKRAERLLLKEIEKLGKGDFDNQLLFAVKNNMIADFYSQTEDIYSRGVFIARAFTQNEDMNKALNYHEEINKIQRDDVIKVVNKYFGDNYLVLQSRMGFPKKEKLEKPGYDPIEPVKDGKSPFAKAFEHIPTSEPNYRFVDKENDFSTHIMNEHTRLYFTPNPINEVFSVYIRFYTGEKEHPKLKYASRMMNMAGTMDLTANELKEKLQSMGCTYNISSDENYVNIDIKGLEKYFDEIMDEMLAFIQGPQLDPSTIKVLYNQEKANRKIENADPSGVGRALMEYALKAEKSSYLDRLSLKEIKKLDADVLSKEFLKVLDYPLEIHVSANRNKTDVVEEVFSGFAELTKNAKETTSPVIPEYVNYDKDIVYFVNKKDAIQSQIYVLTQGNNYDASHEYLIDAFNEYYGGGFSGLVTQEIREYRSMAYAAGAGYSKPLKKDYPTMLTAFIGTQADKTIDAVNIYLELLKNMPEKTERIDNLRESLIQSAITSRPRFRRMSMSSRLWELRGFKDDANKVKLAQFESLDFNEILDFYKESIQNKPYVICVVGDKNTIDIESLKSFGEFIELQEEEIYTN